MNEKKRNCDNCGQKVRLECKTCYDMNNHKPIPYKPSVGETCLISGSNCDDKKGFVYSKFKVLWMNDKFILYGIDGFWPHLEKLEHVKVKPAPKWRDLTKEEVKEHLFKKVWMWSHNENIAVQMELEGYRDGFETCYMHQACYFEHASLEKPF